MDPVTALSLVLAVALVTYGLLRFLGGRLR